MNGSLFKTEDGGHSFTEVLTSSGPNKAEVPGEFDALKTSINGPTQLAYDNEGFLYLVESTQGRLLRLDVGHNSIRVVEPEPEEGIYKEFDQPNAIAADQHGSLFIADFNGRMRKLDTHTGTITVLSPTIEEISDRIFEVPEAMAIDKLGNPLIVDRHHKLFRWNLVSAKPETVAGTGRAGFAGDGALASNALLHFPEGVAVDGEGNIFIADYENCRIRRILGKTNVITTTAGTGNCKSQGDEHLATETMLSYPSSVAVDSKGNVFVIEGNRVRRIDKYGAIHAYAGTGEAGFSGDGGPADRATLNNPSGLAVDNQGNLYVSEFVNNRIRFVDATTHVIKTVAGNGKPHRIDVIM
jgi:sugar lactone lactonase YvrE